MSGRALCKVQLRKAALLYRQSGLSYSQQLPQLSRSYNATNADLRPPQQCRKVYIPRCTNVLMPGLLVGHEHSARCRSLALSGLHTQTAGSGSLSPSESVKSFLFGLQYEAKKGYTNLQGQEKFADFAARHTTVLLLRKQSEHLSDIAEAFKKYDVLSPKDRKAVVDKAMQVVHALTASASAQSGREPISASSLGDASSQGKRLQQTRAQNGSKVSSLKNLVGNRSKQRVPSASVESSSSSSGPHSEGLSVGPQLDDRQQKHMPEGSLSQSNRGIKLMAAEGSGRAQLLTTADLAAACSEPKKEQSGTQSGLSQRAAEHTGGSHPEAFSINANHSEAEQAQIRSAIAVLVGEDAEFSVASEGHEELQGKSATTELKDATGTARRIIKPETIAHRASFTQAAAAAASAAAAKEIKKGEDLGQGEQRTAAWHAEREHRLTASAFGNALGFWPEGRVQLWEEKLQLRAPFKGNAATQWGTVQEDVALQCYTEVTGHIITPCRFAVLRDDEVHGWLGASPDGLIDSFSAQPASPDGVMAGTGPGVLEIKCPFNRGKPEGASVPSLPPWYYMPQVQGLMEIFNREWCNIYLWTVNGSAMFHIPRNRLYWTACFEVLSEYWWAHLVPAKHAIANSRRDEAYKFMPSPKHKLTAALTNWSKAMAEAAPASLYPPRARRMR